MSNTDLLPEIACISVEEMDLVVISPPEYLVKNNTKIAKAWFRFQNKDTAEIKIYDRVELIVEKDCYAEDGVHKGMLDWICYEQQRDDTGRFVLIRTNIFMNTYTYHFGQRNRFKGHHITFTIQT
ncbi:hypothetical protein ACVS9P_08180 [Caproicibacterium sp. NSD3]